MISPTMPTVPQAPQEDPTLASGGMVFRPLPQNQPQPVAMPPVTQQPAMPSIPPNLASGGLVMPPVDRTKPAMPSVPPAPPNPQADKLRQRVGAKQFFLQQLGIDWMPDEEDLRREHDEMPEGDDIVRYSVPEDVAVERKPEEKKEDELTLDFEPFSPDTEEDWVEVAAVEEPVMGGSGNTTHMNKGQQASNPLNPNQPAPKPGDKPQGVIPPVEVTSSLGTASV